MFVWSMRYIVYGLERVCEEVIEVDNAEVRPSEWTDKDM